MVLLVGWTHFTLAAKKEKKIGVAAAAKKVGTISQRQRGYTQHCQRRGDTHKNCLPPPLPPLQWLVGDPTKLSLGVFMAPFGPRRRRMKKHCLPPIVETKRGGGGRGGESVYVTTKKTIKATPLPSSSRSRLLNLLHCKRRRFDPDSAPSVPHPSN